MDEFLKMDIFFAVSTLAVILIAGLVAVGLMRILRILRNVERISDTVSQEAQLIRADIQDTRAKIKREGFKVSHVAKFVRASVKRFAGRTIR